MSQLRLTEMCTAAARQYWNEGQYDKLHDGNQTWSYFSHYNRRLRRCLIHTRLSTFDKPTGWRTQDFVADAFEGVEIATASDVDKRDAVVMGDDVLNGASEQVQHTREWFKRLLVE